MASLQRPPQTPFVKAVQNPIPSSSPAFATPAQPLRPRRTEALSPRVLPQTTVQDAAPSSPPVPQARRTAPPPVLPIILPPQTLRPIAFRTFTKKHNLTLTSSALAALATFVGKHCGSRWREDGLAEIVLEEIARSWKKLDGKVIVDAGGDSLKLILKTLESCMVGGRVVNSGKAGLSRQGSLVSLGGDSDGRPGMGREDSFGISSLDVDDPRDQVDEEDLLGGVRKWLKVVDAFEQPPLVFNPARKHFERSKHQPSFFPSPAQKTELFRQRYHLVHQRLMRNESFQESVIGRTGADASQNSWKVTPIANLRGRNGSGHLLLGLVSITPGGLLAMNDLTGSVHLDIEQASPIDDLESWICPGMIVLVDGVYEEEFGAEGGTLGTTGGIGGTIGGRFIAFSIGAPRCETRAASLGLTGALGSDTGTIGGGFGWVDFLGVGSERAIGSRMRRIEQHTLQQAKLSDLDRNNSKLVMLGNVYLDQAKCLSGLRKVLELYTDAPPTGFVLLGPFISQAAMSSPSSDSSGFSTTSSVTYKESFDSLASLLSDFPSLLRNCTFIFVPGDNDPWPSAFAAGAACALPRHPVPEMFTTRIKRAFANANANTDPSKPSARPPGEAIWTTNPSRLTLFGPRHEIVLLRDDVSGRLRRTAIPLRKTQATTIGSTTGGGTTHGSTTRGSVTGGSTAAADPDIEMATADADADAMQTEQPLDAGTQHARRLTKTLLDQSHVSPFPLTPRPVHWAFGHALSLYPLPSALVLCDAEAEAFAVVYQECCVVNPGALVGSSGGGGGRGGRARWVEFDVGENRGSVREVEL